jgi:hypothetical protein
MRKTPARPGIQGRGGPGSADLRRMASSSLEGSAVEEARGEGRGPGQVI